MRINSVALLNYRNHSNTKVEFSSGVNLVLGRNGAGKSSILEAIGFALYNSDIRTKHEEAVNIESGSSYAVIRVDFTASDGSGYYAERRIGSQPYHRLYSAGESSPRVSGTNDVVKKITGLTGIDGNVKNIYRNLLSCYQNQITQIFAEIESKRKLIFDKIFNTDIYERIAQGDGLKALEDKYSAEIRENEVKMAEKNLLLKDDTELEIKLKDLNSSLESAIGIMNKKSEEIISLKKQKESLDLAKAAIDLLEKETGSLEQQLANKQKLLEEVKGDINIAEKARAIIKENHSAFEQYNKVKSLFDAIEKEIEKLEKEEKEKQKKEKGLEKLINQEIKIISEIENTEKSVREIIDNIGKQEAEFIARKEVIADSGRRALALKSDKERIEAILDEFNLLYGEFVKTKDEISECESRQKGIESQLRDLSGIDEKETAFNEQRDNLLKERKTAEELRSGLKTLEARIKDNESAAKKLKTGICPFLKDECMNISEKGSSLDYFGLRNQELMIEYGEITNSLAKYAGLDEKIAEAEKSLNQMEEWRAGNEYIEHQIVRLRTDIQLKYKDLDIFELKLNALIRNYDKSLADYSPDKALKEMNTALSTLNTDYESNYKVHSAKLEELERLESILNKQKEKLAEAESIIKVSRKELSAVESKKQELLIIIEGFNNRLGGFDDMKANRAGLKTKLGELTESYDLYTANLNKAGETDKYKERADVLAGEINKIILEIESNKAQLAKLNDGFDTGLVDSIKSKIADSEKQSLAMAGAIASAESAIGTVETEISRNTELKKNIRRLGKAVRYLSHKKELTGIFRKNLRDMGKIVASRLIERIEAAATHNYRNISGRGERIMWINNEKDTYAVFLDDTHNRRRFEMLSGGEQVSVALSLRAAMASLMTRANFAIFDEPTINLDEERRIALAESLNKIMSNLEQAIIVTHDGSFREMAGMIIEL